MWFWILWLIAGLSTGIFLSIGYIEDENLVLQKETLGDIDAEHYGKIIRIVFLCTLGGFISLLFIGGISFMISSIDSLINFISCLEKKKKKEKEHKE